MGLFGPERTVRKPLRLMAQDAEDLPPIAALVQDAALRVGDMAFDPVGKHFTLRMNRFCHESDDVAALRAPSVLRISCVERAQTFGLELSQTGLVLSLLDIALEPLEPPAFAMTLHFAGTHIRDVRLEVECIDVLLMDLAAPRRAKSIPRH